MALEVPVPVALIREDFVAVFVDARAVGHVLVAGRQMGPELLRGERPAAMVAPVLPAALLLVPEWIVRHRRAAVVAVVPSAGAELEQPRPGRLGTIFGRELRVSGRVLVVRRLEVRAGRSVLPLVPAPVVAPAVADGRLLWEPLLAHEPPEARRDVMCIFITNN